MTWWMAGVGVRTVWISNDADKVALFQTYPTLPNNCLLPLPWIPSGWERGQVLPLHLQSISALKRHHLLEQSNKGGSHLSFVIREARQRPGFRYWWSAKQSQHHHVSDRELILGWEKCRCCQKSSITFMDSFLKLPRSDQSVSDKGVMWHLKLRRSAMPMRRRVGSSGSTSVNKESELVWHCVLICPIRPSNAALSLGANSLNGKLNHKDKGVLENV